MKRSHFFRVFCWVNFAWFGCLTACGETVWIESVSVEELICEGAMAVPESSADILFSMEAHKGQNLFPSVQVMAPEGGWNLSEHRFVETTISNTGSTPIQVDFWAVGSPEWDAPSGSVELAPSEHKLCSIDLAQRWSGGRVSKVDSRHIEYLRVTMNKPKRGGALNVGPIVLRGTAPASAAIPLDCKRLPVPPMTDDSPAAGRRVRHQLPQFEGTDLYHALYLPTDWESGKRYPIIVEYAGNRWLSAPCHSIGRPEGSRMGYGMSEGKGFIWVNAPFVNPETKTQALNGWGDADATADYAIELVKQLCEKFGGDPSAVILTGFSRGAVAVGCIGRRDDRISDVWLAFHPCQHYDGDGVHGATYEGALNDRGPRILGRSTFHTDNTSREKLQAMFKQLGFPVVFAESGLGAHTDTMFLEDRPSTLKLRKWLAETVALKPGTYVVSGCVTDAAGRGVAGVRIQSGETHFAYSGPAGQYRLAGLVAGQRTVSASKGRWSAERRLMLDGKDTGTINFQMK